MPQPPVMICPGMWRAVSASHGAYYTRHLTIAYLWLIDPANPAFNIDCADHPGGEADISPCVGHREGRSID